MIERPPLIVHIVHRLAPGGMEWLLVDLIRCSPRRFEHIVISLADEGSLGHLLEGRARRYALHKQQGKDPAAYLRLWRLLRRLRPSVVQTYNFGCVDAAAVAWLAGVPRRVHAEHGWNADDAGGGNRKYRLLRRVLRPVIHRYVAVSEHVARWLERDVHVPPAKITRIRNGVDVTLFQPRSAVRSRRREWPASVGEGPVVATVGRLDEVKDQRTLLRAFRLVCDSYDKRDGPRLVLIGDGPMRTALEREAARLELGTRVWFAGRRDDIPALLAEVDIFALSSISEGIPLSLLEAMAAGCPVVATSVGGVPEVVVAGECGQLVPSARPDMLAEALLKYIRDGELRTRHGRAGRFRVETHFNASEMKHDYYSLYDDMIDESRTRSEPSNRRNRAEKL